MIRSTTLILLLLCTLSTQARVASETIFFLQQDGRGYLLQRAMRTDSPSHRFLLDKSVQRSRIRHIAPPDYSWDDSQENHNTLTFQSGSFTIIFPGQLDSGQLTEDKDGHFTYKSWDGRIDGNGHFGIWYSLKNFDEFSYSWVFPDNIELLDHQSNRKGRWVRRNNAVSFYGKKLNNLTFTIRYRFRTPQDIDTGGDQSSPAEGVNRHGDSDKDGIDNKLDLCPDTAPAAKTDRTGCPLDSDKDGVPDGIDQCIGSEEDADVDEKGCLQATAEEDTES